MNDVHEQILSPTVSLGWHHGFNKYAMSRYLSRQTFSKLVRVRVGQENECEDCSRKQDVVQDGRNFDNAVDEGTCESRLDPTSCPDALLEKNVAFVRTDHFISMFHGSRSMISFILTLISSILMLVDLFSEIITITINTSKWKEGDRPSSPLIN
ncbi:MAG: hypothetical protein J3Q66DRAFT_392133 [Benniella sp.]|nr:MAG: hypothetical protein J3Q66DRAFT_392133 [Benniella sp.]